jgi:hypothetical protein
MPKLPKKLIFDPEKVERFDLTQGTGYECYGEMIHVTDGDWIRAEDYDILVALYREFCPCAHCGQVLGHHCCDQDKCPEPGRDPSQPMGGFDTKTTFTLPEVTL